MSDVKAELIRIAAVLAQGHYLPSDLVDDYHQKTYSASRVARMMEAAHEASKALGLNIRDLVDECSEMDAGSGSEQVFVITRAPEAKPLTARELKSLLYFNRTDTEWHVREITK
jgi:hypothetical protein